MLKSRGHTPPSVTSAYHLRGREKQWKDRVKRGALLEADFLLELVLKSFTLALLFHQCLWQSLLHIHTLMWSASSEIDDYWNANRIQQTD